VQLFSLPAGEGAAGPADLGDAFAGGVRVATGDVNGDGIADLVHGSGPGRRSAVVIVDGASGKVIQEFEPFEPSFTGGVFVALADVTGDGRAELIVSPDIGGGPRVRVLRVEDLAVIADFFGIEDPAFRGGAHVAAGDLDGDGRADLIVAAGYGGGPRVAGWNGAALAAGLPVKLFGDFFAFESSSRTGLYVATGDLTGDGRADLIVGGGHDAAPRVMALDGANLMNANEQSILGNFFAGDPSLRDGVRVTAKDLNGDGLADAVVGLKGVVRGYLGGSLPQSGVSDPFREWADLGAEFAGPVYVG
jgi:hypothetical protein